MEPRQNLAAYDSPLRTGTRLGRVSQTSKLGTDWRNPSVRRAVLSIANRFVGSFDRSDGLHLGILRGGPGVLVTGPPGPPRPPARDYRTHLYLDLRLIR